MEIFIFFAIGILVVVIAAIAIMQGLFQRVKQPENELKEEISDLKKRVNDLESDRK
ncbi:hypothetical protein VBD025_16305 [Virgibacillus flavescens]|uniref:hypothetical protein n=1 Tax=Virgibacillus flavescens TaxID=1611422 RepID=UPI003D33571A